MLKWIFGLFLPLFLTILAAAQKPVELTPEQAKAYDETFKGAMDLHNAAKYDDAIAGFTKCLSIYPEDRTSAYNIACGHSLKGELDKAFEWLDKSIAFGFGETNIEQDEISLMEKTDKDLAAMRADPRFAKSIETAKARAKAVEDQVNRQVVYVPAALEGAATVPVLVLLHDAGMTRDALLQSPWKAVADELGLALVLPSGREPVAHAPEKGMTWFLNSVYYSRGAFKYERSINTALDAFKKTRKLDKDRVFIAGEGQGGLVAFNVAISSPSLYKGVLVFDSAVLLQLAGPKVANATKMGFRGKLFENMAGIYGVPPGTDIDNVIGEFGKALAAAKLDKVSVTSYALDEAQPDLRKKLALDALREYMIVEKPPAEKPVVPEGGK